MQSSAKEEKEEVPSGFFSNIRKSWKEDPRSRPIALDLGLGLTLFFLVVISLAPQISQRLGLFSQRKGEQQTFAQEANKRPAVDKVRSANAEKPQVAASRDLQAFDQGALPKDKEKIPKSQAQKKVYGELYGEVTDAASRAPLEGAEVVVKNQYFDTKTTTDEYGNYQIPELPAGKYAITAQKAGFVTQKKPLILSSGEVGAVNFNLKQ